MIFFFIADEERDFYIHVLYNHINAIFVEL